MRIPSDWKLSLKEVKSISLLVHSISVVTELSVESVARVERIEALLKSGIQGRA